MPYHSVEQTKVDLGIEESPPPSGGVDLSNYYTKSEVDIALAAAAGADLSAYYTKAQIDAMAAAKIAITDIVNDLNSVDTSKPLSAAQGKALKTLIDNIMTLLGSDNVNLDTLQEIVDFIELNKATLDTLGISNIAGLSAVLATKADAAHTHPLKTINGQSIEGSGNIEVSGSASLVNIVTGEEYVVPKTIDGKQVYGIRVGCGALPNATIKDVVIPGFNSSYTYWIETNGSYAINSTAYYPIPSPYTTGNAGGITCWVSKTYSSIRILSGDNWSSYNGYITLNYTK